MTENYKLDNVDYQILNLLMGDSMMPFTEIAKKIFVSPGTVHVRMKRLRDLEIVKGSQLIIDYQKIGFDVTAFLGIFLDRNANFDEACKELKKVSEVIEIYNITGTYSVFAKVVCRDTRHLRDVLHHHVLKIKAIQRTETFMTLEECLNRQIKL
jgi:Lrp/AsnC family transcriptional regulator, regulator for asnA, asnC and gidA